MRYAATFAFLVVTLVAGCRSQSTPLTNPFLTPDRVPPPSTQTLAPGAAQPYYPGQTMPGTAPLAAGAPVYPQIPAAAAPPNTFVAPPGAVPPASAYPGAGATYPGGAYPSSPVTPTTRSRLTNELARPIMGLQYRPGSAPRSTMFADTDSPT